MLKEDEFNHSRVVKDLDEFKKLSDLILANFMLDDLMGLKGLVFTRDIYNNK